MKGFYSENQAANYESRILGNAIRNQDFSLVARDLTETSDDMLAAIGRKHNIKLTYRAFRKEDEHGTPFFIGSGKLNTKRLIENIENVWRPLYLNAISLDNMFFAIVYDDDDFDVIEDTKSDFELPDDARLIGSYPTEKDAYDALIRLS